MSIVDKSKYIRTEAKGKNVNFDFIYLLQAALAPVALDLVRQKNLPELYALANIILIVSVLAIIITAPAGAIIMVKLAPKFLQRTTNDER